MNYIKLLWNLYTLKRNENKTYGQVQKLQEKKLRKLLEFAYEQSGYYHRTFEAAGITKGNIHTAPLSQFPSLSKAELLEHFDELITVPNLK